MGRQEQPDQSKKLCILPRPEGSEPRDCQSADRIFAEHNWRDGRRPPVCGFNMSGTDSKAGGPDYLYLFTQGKSIAERLLPAT